MVVKVFCGEEFSHRHEELKDEWEETTQNPFTIPLASGTANLSASFVINNFPDTWKAFKEWESKKEKITEPLGDKNERVVLLYSAETDRFKESIAKYIAIEHQFYVLTAPFIYEKGSGEKKAFRQYWMKLEC